MGKIILNGKNYSSSSDIATAVKYSNTTSGLTATSVQSAIDELNTNKQSITDNNLTTTSKTIPGAINELNDNLTSLTTKLSNAKIVLGSATITTDGNGAFVLTHNGNFSGVYVCLIATKGSSADHFTCDTNTSNSVYGFCYGYTNNLGTNTTKTVNYVCIGV